MQHTRLHLALLGACGLLPLVAAHAATPAMPDAADLSQSSLDRITVTATLTERAIADVPATVEVISRERLDRELVVDFEDLVRYEPGVSVGSSATRFGIQDVRIRGLGGNRVQLRVDGTTLPNAFSIGSFSASGRDQVDLDSLKQVEILRGPSSALYGSDALGGVVSFVTKDPEDYTDTFGESVYIGLKTGMRTEDDSAFATATHAWAGERFSTLLVATRRDGQERDNQGDNDVVGAARTTPNPQSTGGGNLLAKLVFAPDDDQRFRLGIDGNESTARTDVQSSLGPVFLGGPSPSAITEGMQGDDRQTRARIALEHTFSNLAWGLADSGRWQVYRQDSETTQDTRELRTSLAGGVPGATTLRQRRFNFDQRVVGLDGVLYKNFDTGNVAHRFTYGLEYVRTDTRQKRDGTATNLSTGVTTPSISPDVFPVRDFPISRTTEAALFVQDEIDIGALTLTPAVRVDRYELDPRIDNIFAEDNPGVAVTGITETRVSPKFGAVWRMGETWSLYGGYAAGFRSPPYDDANLGFTNLAFGYTALPNPDLKPETSDGIEFGVRASGENAYLSLGGFFNRYDDFIESLMYVGDDPVSGLMQFQSRNIAEVEIKGIELKAGFGFGIWSDALENLSLRSAVSFAEGDDKTAGVPLASVDPARAVIGLAWDAEAWGVELVGRFAERKRRLEAPVEGGTPTFAPPGYAIADLLFHYEFSPHARLNLGVFNLADKHYWDWSDAAALGANSAVLDRFSAPGRNASVSLDLRW